MDVDGVHKVDQAGRVMLPQSIREKYKGEHLAIAEVKPGKLRIEQVGGSD